MDLLPAVLLVVIIFLIAAVIFGGDSIASAWNELISIFTDTYRTINESLNFNEVYRNRNDAIEKKIDDLVEELIRVNYCTQILGNPPMTQEVYEKRIATLKYLEECHPHLKRPYSPTMYPHFREGFAVQAYGYSRWIIMKRTLDLTREQ